MTNTLPVLSLFGLHIHRLDAVSVLQLILARFSARERTNVGFVNSNLIHTARRSGLARSLSSNFLLLNDGIAVDVLAAIVWGQRFSENLNGTDLTPRILSALPRHTRVFLYGAKDDVVQKAAQRLTASYHVSVCGVANGFSKDPAAVAGEVKKSGAEVVLVALGNPAQERWIIEHGATTGATLLIAVGAYFDFVSGNIPRAPDLIRRVRLEWLYRLAHEPRRLVKRYLFDTTGLLILALGSRLLGRFSADEG